MQALIRQVAVISIILNKGSESLIKHSLQLGYITCLSRVECIDKSISLDVFEGTKQIQVLISSSIQNSKKQIYAINN